MKIKKTLTALTFLMATQVVCANQNPGILYGPSRLEGYCIHTQNNQTQKLMEFNLIQDPRGGTETLSRMVPNANARITVEYESNGTLTGPVKYYHARFLMHTLNGDLAVLKSNKKFEYLDHEQQLSATFEPKIGVQIECEANVLKVD